MVRKAGEDSKPEKMLSKRLRRLGCFSRPSRIGQSPQYNQRNKTKACYRDPFSFHTNEHGGANNSIRKQNRRVEEAHIYKREKYLNLIKELEDAGYKAVEVGARGFIWSSVYDLHENSQYVATKEQK